jgi:ribonuclease HI
VKLTWVPFHIGLVRNERVDDRARQVALEGSIFDTPLSSSDFQSLGF